ncbi:MAG TPA: hypothetical protein VMU88_06485 [bacterium]|nr:hypothetical protein [bacterium]
MPALPDANASSNAAALPPLPGANASSTAGTMPPLPSSNNASAAPAAGVTAEPSANSQASTNWSSPSLSVPPSGPASAPKVPGVPQAKVAKPHKMTPAEKYRYDHTRPNVIYGGWVWPKGGEVDDRLAWTSQEILNALVPHGFNVSKEEGNYDGEDTTTPQWRQWTFSIDHSNVVTQVYIRPVKQRIWVRVGPSEAPADMTLAQVEAIRKQDLRMLKLLRRQLGKRFTPHHRGDWSAPYNYKRATADE